MKRVETIGFEIKTISNLIKRKINESPFEFNDLTGMQVSGIILNTFGRKKNKK